jgi:thiamine-phosphate pyrophosphorylase
MKGLPERCLMLVTEPGERLIEIVGQAVDGGVDIVQWRDKRVSIGKRNKYLGSLSAVTKDRAVLVANGDWGANIRAGARAIHLPELSAPIGVIRFRVGNGALVGKSVHSVAAAQQAERDGADYLIAGTIFASPSHPEITPSGVEFLRQACEAVSIPVLAIGGVTPENVSKCIEAGAAGVAVLSPIMRVDDPCAVARQYRAALDAAWEKKQCN